MPTCRQVMATITVTKIVATTLMSKTQPKVGKGVLSRLGGDVFGRDTADRKPLTTNLSSHHSPNLRRIHRADAARRGEQFPLLAEHIAGIPRALRVNAKTAEHTSSGSNSTAA